MSAWVSNAYVYIHIYIYIYASVKCDQGVSGWEQGMVCGVVREKVMRHNLTFFILHSQ